MRNKIFPITDLSMPENILGIERAWRQKDSSFIT